MTGALHIKTTTNVRYRPPFIATPIKYVSQEMLAATPVCHPFRSLTRPPCQQQLKQHHPPARSQATRLPVFRTAGPSTTVVASSRQQAPSSDMSTMADSNQSLLDFISASPLLGSCGLDRAAVQAELEQWVTLGNRVIADLKFGSLEELNEAQKRRIFQYYLPVFFWCQRQLQQHRAAGENGGGGQRGPLILGISAPQGCGKTTLCEQLQELFEFTGCRAASISIDDFYLTHADQKAVAAAHADNPLLQQRGNAGSHDMALGTDTLRALRQATAPGAKVPIPRYDKSAFQGQGDRADPSTWPAVEAPVDVVLFEGWMLGFAPVGEAAAAAVDPNLAAVDGFLQSYREAWDSFVDAWLVVRVEDPQYAYRWRLQAEHAMRATGRPAMTDEQVQRFVERFMPAYRCYLPGLYSSGPTTARHGHLLTVEVDENREPTQQQPAAVI